MQRSFVPRSALMLLAGCLTIGILKPIPLHAQPARPVYEQWTTYLNPKLSWEVPVPPGLQAQNDPKRGGSCRFVSGDGAFVLKTWGSPKAGDPGTVLEDAWREALSLRGRRIDFQRRETGNFVLAGMTAEGAEFFEKVILGRGAVAGMNLSWPPSLAGRYAAWVQEIEQGFGWHPEAAALTERGVPPRRGIFSGVRDYFTDDADAPSQQDRGPGPEERPMEPPPANQPEAGRDPNRTKVDLTPPPPLPPKVNPAGPAPEKTKATPAVKPEEKPVPVKREDLPYGITIPGKKGFVYSPYGAGNQQVDVSGIPTGTKVKCPYTGKVFRVP